MTAPLPEMSRLKKHLPAGPLHICRMAASCSKRDAIVHLPVFQIHCASAHTYRFALLLALAQGPGEAHFFFLSCSNSISLGSPVSVSPAASWNLRIASRVAGPTVP